MTAETEHQKDISNSRNNAQSQTGGFSNKDGETMTHEEKSKIDQPLGFNSPGDDALKETADEIMSHDDRPADHDQSAEGESEDPFVTLVNDLKQAHAQKDELQNQLLRNVAEMENLRKRTHREISDSRQFAITAFARDLLSVADNLRRAINAAPQKETETNSEGLKNLLEGVCMTERELLSILEKHKVRKTSPMGEKFDPNFHQAMLEIPNVEVPNNTIMEVVQEGYIIGERMLRPAMVSISKGGPKTPMGETGSPGETVAAGNKA